MKKLFLWLALACGLAAWGVEYKLEVTTDRPEALYTLGESAGFIAVPTIDGKPADQGEVVFTVNNDRNNSREEVYRFWLPDQTRIDYALPQPGFAFCRAALWVDGKEVASGETAAGFSPDLIRQGMPEPADFDAFWAKGKKEAEKVRLDAGGDYARVTPAPDLSTDTLDVSRVNFANVDGKRLWGFLAVPKNGDGPFPAVVVVPGASPSNNAPGGHLLEGVITLFLNVHDYDPDNGECPDDYPMIGAGDRDANFFRRAWLGMDQATEWLRQHPKFDGENLGVCGWSQGGGSTLALAGLNPNFTYAVSNQPALCDFGAGLQGRQPGWPFYAHRFRHQPEVLDEVAYVDCANLARRIECPIVVLVGFIDGACSPGSIYAAFNNIPSQEKIIVDEPNTNHTWNDAYSQARENMRQALLGN